MLDLADFGANPHAPEFGDYGVVYVRWGKGSKGSPPKRRSVLTVFPWSARVLRRWAGQFRGLFGRAAPGGGTLWPSERSPRVSLEKISARFAEYRDALGLPDSVSLHSLRHSYITHLIEDGYDPLFVQFLSSPRKGVHDVQHEPGRCGNLRAGGGYLRSSVTQIPRRSDACAAGADARLVA